MAKWTTPTTLKINRASLADRLVFGFARTHKAKTNRKNTMGKKQS